MNRTLSRLLATIAAAAFASTLLAGCALGSAPDQTVNDAGGMFHMVVPGDWSVTQGPNVITLYGAKDAPAADAAIGKTPWYFVMTATGQSATSVPKELAQLAKQRAHSRGWKNTTFGTPAKSTLGAQPAYEMDIAGTDERGRAFDGKLTLARVEGNEVLVFAFAQPGAFDADEYDKVKKDFFWHTSAQSNADTRIKDVDTATK